MTALTTVARATPARSAPARAVTGSVLVADLGGTHLRLGLALDGSLQRTHVARWSEVPDLVPALRAFLGDARPARACLAVAAPVGGDRVQLTNQRVGFSRRALAVALGLEELRVVNDLAALARSVTALRTQDQHPLGGTPLDTSRTVVVVAPGTGLGAAALVPTRGAPVVVSGEAGHVPLPATGRSLDVARALLEFQVSVTAEDVLSGRGLPVLDVVVRTLAGERDARHRSAQEITAEDGPTVEVFVDLLAAFTQGCVLSLGARGGVLLGGGIVGRVLPALERAGFAEQVAAHPQASAYLSGLPVVLDRRPTPALDGAALFLEDPS